MLLYLWSAFASLPSPERLAQSRMMPIPTLHSAALLVGRSAIELGVVLAIVAPWWHRGYALRLLCAALLIGAWFLATTPLTLSAMHWVHRRWLAVMAAALFSCFLVASVAAALRRGRAA